MPQNIKRVMQHYDCIVDVVLLYKDQCQIYITGEVKPGNDQVTFKYFY